VIPFTTLCVLLTINGQPIGCAPGEIRYFNADSPRHIRSGGLVIQNPRVDWYLYPELRISGVVVDRLLKDGFERVLATR